MGAFETLQSGFGFWNPFVWLGVFLLTMLIALLIRGLGTKKYKPGTPQTKPFISGNREENIEQLHVRAGNLYWGFLESMKSYYKHVVRIHSGMISDYLLWLFATMAIILVIGIYL
ncbi:hydrogenase [bacterium]|nr:hydrogenase [bacterium]